MAVGIGALNTGSTLAFASGNNKTSTAISTNILITIGGTNIAVGAVKSLAINEKRDIALLDEVGTDGHIDSVPRKSSDFSGTCQRVRFDGMRIAEAFGRAFFHVSSQAYPFDIVVIDRQKLALGSQISTVIKNVWITGIDYTYSADDWVITDNMTWVAETMYSHLNSGSATPAATGGERQVPLNTFGLAAGTLSVEQLADTGAGGRRGSLDAAGLLDLGSAGGTF